MVIFYFMFFNFDGFKKPGRKVSIFIPWTFLMVQICSMFWLIAQELTIF